jgi:hypothetical protein
MARKLRVPYLGVVCHLMTQGACWEDILQKDNDGGLFLETLGQAGEKTDCQFHV